MIKNLKGQPILTQNLNWRQPNREEELEIFRLHLVPPLEELSQNINIEEFKDDNVDYKFAPDDYVLKEGNVIALPHGFFWNFGKDTHTVTGSQDKSAEEYKVLKKKVIVI
jgi:hypothetical protein